MEMMPLKPERKAQVDEYARRRGQDPVAALDEVLAEALEWEQQDFEESVEAVRVHQRSFERVSSARVSLGRPDSIK